jgi:hypothetical protein
MPTGRLFDPFSSYSMHLSQLLCNKHHAVLTVQRVFIVEHYFRKQSYGTGRQAHQVHVPDIAVPNKSLNFSTCFPFLRNWAQVVMS